jgi:hypothetical protein
MSDSLKSRLDEQDLIEDDVSSVLLSVAGRRVRAFSLTCVKGVVEIVCQKNIEILPVFLSSDLCEILILELDLALRALPRSIDVDFRVDQTMTLSFEIVS